MSVLPSTAPGSALGRRPRESGSRFIFVVSILSACIIQLASNAAQAQCTARDVSERQPKLKTRTAEGPRAPIGSERELSTWKTITIGTFPDSLKLRDELDSKGCNVGGQAAEILARPTFMLASRKRDIELALVSPAQLGFTSDTVALADVYARARSLGLELAAAEIGPQLRLQYLDQPVGEFLIIGMEPLKTWSGEPIILNVANGGAGLILVGQDGRAEAEIAVTSRIVFARARQSAPGRELIDQAAAVLPK